MDFSESDVLRFLKESFTDPTSFQMQHILTTQKIILRALAISGIFVKSKTLGDFLDLETPVLLAMFYALARLGTDTVEFCKQLPAKSPFQAQIDDLTGLMQTLPVGVDRMAELMQNYMFLRPCQLANPEDPWNREMFEP